MGATRLRAGALVVAAAAVVVSGLALPVVAQAVTPVPQNLAPNDPGSAPTSAALGTELKNVVLTWDDLANTSTYEVQVSDETGTFESPAIDVQTPFASYAPSAKLPRGDYAWRVRATGGTWSSPAYFTRGWPDSPGNPQFVGPNAADTQGPVLTWDALPDASYYEVQFNPVPFNTTPYDEGATGDPAAADKVSTCLTASTEFTPYNAVVGLDAGITGGDATNKCVEFGDGGTFYWRVRARDGAYDPSTATVTAPARACTGVWYSDVAQATGQGDECSAWAYPATDSFTINKTVSGSAPGVPGGLDVGPRALANTSPVVVSNTPAFAWNAVPGTTFYRVYQSRTPSMNTLDHQWDTTATGLSPVLQMRDTSVRTYWTVQACAVNKTDVDGFVLTYAANLDMVAVCGDPAPWQSYVKTTPASVQNISAAPVTGGITLTWSTAGDVSKPNGSLAAAVDDVKGYEVQFSDAYGAFTSPSLALQVDRQGTTPLETSATVDDSTLPATGYNWRVRGVDSSGNKYPWSDPTTVGTLQSARGALTTASGFALNAPLNFKFNAPVDGVSTSSAHIVASNNAVVPGTVAATGATTYRFTPAGFWTAGESYRLQVTTAVTTADTTVPATASSAVIRAATTVDSSSAALTTFAGDYAWTTLAASDALGGSYIRSNDKTSTATRSYVSADVRGGSVSIYGCMGPSSGQAKVYFDGTFKKTIDFYKSYSVCGKVASISLPSGATTVKVAVNGTKQSKATGTYVRFDGFKVS